MTKKTPLGVPIVVLFFFSQKWFPAQPQLKIFFLLLDAFKAWRTYAITHQRPHARTQAGRHSAHTWTHTRCAHAHTHTHAHAHTFARFFSAPCGERIASSSALLIKAYYEHGLVAAPWPSWLYGEWNVVYGMNQQTCMVRWNCKCNLFYMTTWTRLFTVSDILSYDIYL